MYFENMDRYIYIVSKILSDAVVVISGKMLVIFSLIPPTMIWSSKHMDQMQTFKKTKYHLNRFKLITTGVVSYSVTNLCQHLYHSKGNDCVSQTKNTTLLTSQCLTISQLDPKIHRESEQGVRGKGQKI